MSISVLEKLPDNKLLVTLDKLRRDIEYIKTIQNSGSDISAPFTAGVVATNDFSLVDDATWEDIPDLTIDLTITEPSIIMVIMCCNLSNDVVAGNTLSKARMLWDGSPEGKECHLYCQTSALGLPAMCNTMQTIRIVENTSGTYTLKMQAMGDALRCVVDADTSFAYWVFKQ